MITLLAGHDPLQGGDGNDYLSGGLKRNTLIGSAGADQFVFDTLVEATNVDRIRDSISGEDRLVSRSSGFSSLAGQSGSSMDAAELAYGSLPLSDHVLATKSL